MTVNYSRDASTSKPWTFFKLLFKWKGSIWKAVYLELLIFLVIYETISVVYRCCLNQSQQKSFEAVVRFFDTRLSYIPLELVLGFFCTQVFNRWNKQYDNIGFIDNIGLMTALYVRGRCEKAIMYRRNILRYCELVQVLVFRDISMKVRRRFPTIDTIVAAGFMLPHEKEIYESYSDAAGTPKYWIPANWALSLTYHAWRDGCIESAYYKVTLQEMRDKKMANQLGMGIQLRLGAIAVNVVCMAVHLYFLVCVMSRQQVIVEHELKTEVDTYFPVMTALQFVFYMGWMKVIQGVINPFGEDDDDFETNALIDRNITMGMMIVDEGYDRPPELLRDPFWDGIHPLYSEETSRIPNHPPRGSASQVKLASSVSEVVMMPHQDCRNTPQFCTAASLRKSARVQVKDDERTTARRTEDQSFLSSIKLIFSKVCCNISLLLSFIKSRRKGLMKDNPLASQSPMRGNSKYTQKPPITRQSAHAHVSVNPISIAIPTQSPTQNEKLVM